MEQYVVDIAQGNNYHAVPVNSLKYGFTGFQTNLHVKQALSKAKGALSFLHHNLTATYVTLKSTVLRHPHIATYNHEPQ